MSKFYGKHVSKTTQTVPKTMQKRMGCKDRFWIAFPVSILLG